MFRRSPFQSTIAAALPWLAAATFAFPAHASNGVLELNASCAVQTGCFAGDTPGLPVTITAYGSYRLTDDLVVPDENTSAILISANDVSVDLNGFSIVRAGCDGALGGPSCVATSGTGAGVAVLLQDSTYGTSVRNGSVVGMGGSGISLGRQSRIHDVRVRWNRLDGINTRDGSVVSDSQSEENGGDGFDLGIGSVVSKSSAVDNGEAGIFASDSCVIQGNSVERSGLAGIESSGRSVIAENMVLNSVGAGIDGALHSLISSNSAAGNSQDGIAVTTGSLVYGNASGPSTLDGVAAGNGSSVRSNVLRSNREFGLDLGNATYRNNTVVPDNGGGTVDGGIDMGGNSCDGNASCP